MTVIPATKDKQSSGGFQFEASPGKKSVILPSQQINQVWWCMSANPAVQEAVGRRIMI
jgi:hypothetical protein